MQYARLVSFEGESMTRLTFCVTISVTGTEPLVRSNATTKRRRFSSSVFEREREQEKRETFLYFLSCTQSVTSHGVSQTTFEWRTFWREECDSSFVKEVVVLLGKKDDAHGKDKICLD